MLINFKNKPFEYKFIIVSIALMALGLLLNFISNSITPNSQQSWGNIIPGKSTKSQTIEALGSPINISSMGNVSILTYPSDNEHYSNEIHTSSEEVVYIKEMKFSNSNRSYSDLTKNLLTPPVKLYGPDTPSGVYLFTYNQEGVAFLTNPQNDIVYEVWYFPIQDISSLLRISYFDHYTSAPAFRSEL